MRTSRLLALVVAGMMSLPGGTLAQESAAPAVAPQSAEVLTPFALSELSALAQTDPVAALARIEALLTQDAQSASADPRVVLDLQILAAELLLQQGRPAEAAQVFEVAARFAVRERDRTGAEPAVLWTRAAEAHEAAGDPRAAVRALEARLTEEQEGGLPPEALEVTRQKILALGGELPPLADTPAPMARTAPMAATRAAEEGFTRVEVFYATDRARTGDASPLTFYGAERGTLDYGLLEVTVPDTHRAGAIERPSIWRLEFSETPAKHVMLQSVLPLEADQFFGQMRERIDSRARKEAFVFIHGYNVSFAAGAKRAAQLAYDMNFSGVPVLYSWPSRGATTGYLADAAVVQLSARRLSHFLDDLVERSGATTIHIIAHSMGNRALTEALELMALRNQLDSADEPVFDQVVFAAPDVDAGLFAEMLPTIRPLARRLTLYASENDWALQASRQLHGNAPRAGQGGPDTLAAADIDSLDMSDLGEDMLAHGYFADDRSALLDLAALFWLNPPPELRCGLEKTARAGTVPIWRYVPGECPGGDLLAVMARLQENGVRTRAEAEAALPALIGDPELARQITPVVVAMFPAD